LAGGETRPRQIADSKLNSKFNVVRPDLQQHEHRPTPFLFAKTNSSEVIETQRAEVRSQTASFLRPFLRLLATVLVPVLVLIRFKNPCFLSLFFFFGWYVFDILFYYLYYDYSISKGFLSQFQKKHFNEINKLSTGYEHVLLISCLVGVRTSCAIISFINFIVYGER